MLTSSLVAGVVLDKSQVRRKVKKPHNHAVGATDNYCPHCGKYLWQEIENELGIDGITPFPINDNETAFIVGEVVVQVVEDSVRYAFVKDNLTEYLDRVKEKLGSLCNDTLGIYLMQLDDNDSAEFKYEEF